MSPAGNNANNGTSLASPFRTIQHAASQTYPGDVVQVLPGTYNSPNPPILAALTIFRSGTAARPIVYKAHDPANRPRIKISQGGGIFSSASYIEINGFVVEGGAAEIDPAYAQYLYDNDRNNKYIDATGIGVACNGFISYCNYPRHVKILNNEVYNMAGNGIGTVRADYITISGNRSHDNAIIIDDFRNTQNVDASCPLPPQPYLYTGKVLVFNNRTYNNGGSGIHAYESNNVDIVHNVAYKNGTHPDLGGEIFSNTGKNVRILNNILYANTTEIVNFGNDASVLYDYNIYYNGTASPSYGRPPAKNVIADPLFVNPAARDFHLQAGSPAINAGSALVTDPLLAKDYDNNTRPYAGTLPDRGAFETTTGGTASLTVQAESFCLQSGLTAWSTGIGDFSPGDYARYCAVSLGTGYNRLTFNVGTVLTGTIYVRLDSPTGATVGTFNFTGTGDWGTYQEQTIALTGATGTRDVYLVGGSGTLNLDWVRFSNSGPARFAGLNAGALAAYPNPARTVLYIPLPPGHRGGGRVVLTDVLGRRVLAEAATPGGGRGEMQLDVSRVGKGTYLLTVTHGGGRQVSRVAIVE